ncbi:hypothetical protein, partial [Microbispora rosea]
MNLAALHPAVLHPNLRVRIAVGFLQRLLDSMVMSFMAIYLAFEYGVAVAAPRFGELPTWSSPGRRLLSSSMA